MTEPNKIIALVVDDEFLIRSELADLLASQRLKTMEAPTADKALNLLEQHSGIALLILDLDLPGFIDGPALAQIVSTRWPQIRIIAISGADNADALPRHVPLLRKPIDEAEFLRLCDER